MAVGKYLAEMNKDGCFGARRVEPTPDGTLRRVAPGAKALAG